MIISLNMTFFCERFKNKINLKLFVNVSTVYSATIGKSY